MKRPWLESKVAYYVFLMCSWVIVLLGIAAVFMLTPWFGMIQRGSAWPFLRIVGASIGIATVIAGPIIFLGMAIFCIMKDHSSRYVRMLWLFAFFMTACFGAAVYFFSVYRKQVRSRPVAQVGAV